MSDCKVSSTEDVAYKLFVFVVEAERIYENFDDHEEMREYLFDTFRECLTVLRSSQPV